MDMVNIKLILITLAVVIIVINADLSKYTILAL